MSNYVQDMWQDQNFHRQQQGKSTRVLGWTLSVLLVVAAAAALSSTYWYPYVQPYMHF
jgi:hypothetical protein